VKAFSAPETSIGSLGADIAATLIATASDVAIVVDGDGIIQDIAFQRADLSIELEGSGKWYGRHWSEIVSPASQHKVAALIEEVGTQTASRWRQLTHQTTHGRDVPFLYAAVKLGASDRFVALGRDLRAVATLQQRLVDAQMALERDFAKLRFAETRYRLLFQSSSEPVIILDAATLRVLEANPAATALLESGSKRGTGRPFAEIFDARVRPRLQGALAELKSSGKMEDVEARLASGDAAVVSASVFRQDAASLVLVRITPTTQVALPTREAPTSFADFARLAPDGFVITDGDGRVLLANAAFAQMIQVRSEEDLRGGTLDQWFGRSGVDFDIMMANLRQHGSIRLFPAALHTEGGVQVHVEASAVALGAGKDRTFGFAIRDVGRRLDGSQPRGEQELPRSATQLSELIGRVPLKDLVRETTDVIERLCIEKALELTGDNRASAAEMLGLSRQSLYVKLRRFGFADAIAEDENQA
jgi:transcriptional regulator PpsR